MILLVSPLPPPEGGIAIWTKQYIEYCKNNNIDFSIVNIALTGKRSNKINDKRSITDEIKRTFSIVSDLKSKLRLHKPQYVHINSSCAKFGLIRDTICVRIAKKAGSKVILHFRCNVQDKLGEGIFRKKLFLKISKSADVILTLNSPSENFVKSNLPSARVITVPNFISIEEKPFNRIINTDVKTILYVGHVQFDKGAREIFRTAESFPDKTFLLAGPVAKEVSFLDCPDNVKLLNRVEHSEVYRLMNEADVFLFPSYTEGFSNALVEAMASGLPVIATDVGANKDMIEDKGGFIVPAESSYHIITALKEIQNYHLRDSMSRWNYKKVFENYKTEIVMQKLLDIYDNIG